MVYIYRVRVECHILDVPHVTHSFIIRSHVCSSCLEAIVYNILAVCFATMSTQASKIYNIVIIFLLILCMHASQSNIWQGPPGFQTVEKIQDAHLMFLIDIDAICRILKNL